MLRIVNQQGHFLKLRNTRSITQFCLKTTQVASQKQLGLLTFSAKINTGELALHLPLYITASYNDTTRYQGLIEKIWKAHLQYSLTML